MDLTTFVCLPDMQLHRSIFTSCFYLLNCISLSAQSTDSLFTGDKAEGLFQQYLSAASELPEINAEDFYYKGTTIKDLETFKDEALIRTFLNGYFDSIEWITPFGKPDEFIQYLHTIDLNGDHLADIIYQGPTGGEIDITEFFLQTNTGFKKVFSGYQTICSMEFCHQQLCRFVLANPGCCDDPQEIENFYEVTFLTDRAVIFIDSSIGFLRLSEQPLSRFNTALRFTTTAAHSRLRSETLLFDNAIHPVRGSVGNIICTYTAGNTGMALATKQNNTGTWIFVLMDAVRGLETTPFDRLSEHPTKIYGWMLVSDTDLHLTQNK